MEKKESAEYKTLTSPIKNKLKPDENSDNLFRTSEFTLGKTYRKRNKQKCSEWK